MRHEPGLVVEEGVGRGVRLLKGACGEAGKVAHGVEDEAGRPIFQRMSRLWVPKRLLVTPSALDWPYGAAVADRVAALGAEVVRLKSDRLTGLPDTYRDAKTTMALVSTSASRRRLQPIPPSADWRFDLAEGCPAHCQYCYLAGSLAGPPIIRVYANLPEILAELAPALGQGRVTSVSAAQGRGGNHL